MSEWQMRILGIKQDCIYISLTIYYDDCIIWYIEINQHNI